MWYNRAPKKMTDGLTSHYPLRVNYFFHAHILVIHIHNNKIVKLTENKKMKWKLIQEVG